MTTNCCINCADYDNDSGRICANPACDCHKSAENKCTCPTFSIGEKVLHKSDCALRGFATDTRCKHGVHGTDCSKCFHTDTSDWRERFGETDFGFVMNGNPKQNLIAFIEEELERAREKTLIQHADYFRKQGQRAEQSRIITLAEGVKGILWSDDLHQYNRNIASRKTIDTLISKIKDHGQD